MSGPLSWENGLVERTHEGICQLSLTFCNLAMATAQQLCTLGGIPPCLRLRAVVLGPPARKRRLHVNFGLGMPRNRAPQQWFGRADPVNYVLAPQPQQNPGLHVCISGPLFWDLARWPGISVFLVNFGLGIPRNRAPQQWFGRADPANYILTPAARPFRESRLPCLHLRQ